MYADVIVDIASERVDRVFVYAVPEKYAATFCPGTRVRVPFGFREKEGYILRMRESTDFDPARIREIISPMEDYPAIPENLIALAEEVRADSHCPLCEALRLMIPSEMRGERIRVKTETCLRVTFPPQDAEKMIAEQSRSWRRKLILTALSDGLEHPLEEIRSLIKNWSEPVEQLARLGLIERYEREVFRNPWHGETEHSGDPELTAEQQDALAELIPALHRGKGETFLLHGVTGSGKTEVFVRLVRQALQMGKSAVILVPEIALTPQMTRYFHSRFGEELAVLHSRLTAGERFDEWRRIRFGKARIVVGARSAIFAPVRDPGVFIIDEEHETTYLSDHFPQYDARRIAEKRAVREGAAVVLASATPSIATYARARRGDFTLIEMPHRVLDRPLPRITVTDMREELRLGNRSIFSEALKTELRECLSRGEQAMLFMNRRGYAPFVNCRKCGESIRCRVCDVTMTYHATDGRLHCHYCGGSEPMPERCPSCQSPYIRTCGIGTQKVEEEVRNLFGAACVRMDNDTTASRDAHEKLLNRFRTGEAQVLIGTQMIAKGHDFPSVTLVGAVLADSTLNLPDYRSAERTFQLLVQVAGRAGRGEKEGHVIIQTYQPEHYAIRAAEKQDYRLFFNEEFTRRKRDLYPPFTQMDRVLFEGADQQKVRDECAAAEERIRAYLQEKDDLRRRVLFIRSDDAPISRIQNRYRAQVLIKMIDLPVMEPLLQFVQEMVSERENTANGQVTASFEMNPVSLA